VGLEVVGHGLEHLQVGGAVSLVGGGRLCGCGSLRGQLTGASPSFDLGGMGGGTLWGAVGGLCDAAVLDLPRI